MSEYYAVVRSREELAHYGVRGMKWGVRKAVQRGSDRKLTRQYKKAAKKLERLNAKADVNRQKELASQHKKIAKAAAAVGLAGASTALGGTAAGQLLTNAAKKTALAKKLNYDRYNEAASKLTGQQQKKFLRAHDKMLKAGAPDHIRESVTNKALNEFEKKDKALWDSYKNSNQKLKDQFNRQAGGAKAAFDVSKAAKAVGGVGLGIATGAALAARRAKKLTTEKGHAKAIAKRDAWKAEMNKAFAGTKYAGQYAAPARKKKRK